MNNTLETVLITIAAVHLFNLVAYYLNERFVRSCVQEVDWYLVVSTFFISGFIILLCLPYKLGNYVYWRVKVWRKRRQLKKEQ